MGYLYNRNTAMRIMDYLDSHNKSNGGKNIKLKPDTKEYMLFNLCRVQEQVY